MEHKSTRLVMKISGKSLVIRDFNCMDVDWTNLDPHEAGVVEKHGDSSYWTVYRRAFYINMSPNSHELEVWICHKGLI